MECFSLRPEHLRIPDIASRKDALSMPVRAMKVCISGTLM